MSEVGSYQHQRPFGVTVVVVLMWIQGIFEVLGGIALFLERNDVDLGAHIDAGSGTIGTLGIVLIVTGLITVLLANMLSRGSNFVRLLIGFISAINLGSALWAFIAFEGTTRWNAVFQALVALAVLYILFGNRESQEFFAD